MYYANKAILGAGHTNAQPAISLGEAATAGAAHNRGQAHCLAYEGLVSTPLAGTEFQARVPGSHLSDVAIECKKLTLSFGRECHFHKIAALAGDEVG